MKKPIPKKKDYPDGELVFFSGLDAVLFGK